MNKTKLIAAIILFAFLLVSLLPGILDEFGRWHNLAKIYPTQK
jgi:hypothetical protein